MLTSTPDESLSTAQFIISDEGNAAKIVTVLVVHQHQNPGYFPLEVSLEIGSRVSVTDTGTPPFIPGALQASAVRIQPAGGVIIIVQRKLQEQSTIQIDINNTPENSESLLVI